MSNKQVENLFANRGASTTEQLAVTRQMVMLQAASARISETLDHQEVVESIPKEFAAIFSFDNCTFYLTDSDNQPLIKAAEHNPKNQVLPDYNHSSNPRNNNNNARNIVVSGLKTVHVNRRSAKSFPKEWKFLKKHKYKSHLMIPIAQHGKVLGILEVLSKKEIDFAAHEFVIIKLFTDNSAIAIENAELFKQTKREIENRKLAEEKLRHDALHDELTGLPNRTLFLDRLERLILRTKRQTLSSFAVIYLDLDNFKLINDTFGHLEGDKVLIKVANILSENVRDIDTVSRFGGDEFLILLDGYPDANNLEDFVDRIQDLLSKPIKIHDHEVVITASIGIAMPLSDNDSAEDYIRNSDIAMYNAKSLGKGRYEYFSETKGVAAKQRLRLESELRNSIKHMRFLVHYQPIVALDSKKVIGLEALLRWQPVQGEIQLPDSFIGHLETMGLMFDVGLWVLREASGNLVLWQEKYQFDPPLTISVNISNSQVVHPRFIGELENIIAEVGINPKQLILEITENIFIRDAELVSKLIRKIQALGVQIHLDDFGTGYSSLGYLNKLPIDAIKIDRAFVQEVVSPDKHRGVINSIILLAQDLGLNVIAEGIESNIHMEYLEKTGCKYGQGFLFDAGLDTKDIEKLFKNQKNKYS
jgi:diguanylate cyclase (GGDEF)-like protein